MRVTLRHLSRLPVVTVSGQAIGRVADVEIESDTLRLVAFHVQPRAALPGLLGRKLIIEERQVVRLSADELVVEDGSVRDRLPATAPDAPAAG